MPDPAPLAPPPTPKGPLYRLMNSSKFWSAVIGVAAVIVQAYVPKVSPEQATELAKWAIAAIAALLGSHIIATGIEDQGNGK